MIELSFEQRKEFFRKVKKIREKKGIKVQAFEEALNISRQTYYRIINNENRDGISENRMQIIADVLDEDLDTLLKDIVSPENEDVMSVHEADPSYKYDTAKRYISDYLVNIDDDNDYKKSVEELSVFMTQVIIESSKNRDL